MELAVVKITDLKSFLSELKALKVEVKELREQENLKSYSVQETADKLGMSYNSVRKLIQENKLVLNQHQQQHFLTKLQQQNQARLRLLLIR